MLKFEDVEKIGGNKEFFIVYIDEEIPKLTSYIFEEHPLYPFHDRRKCDFLCATDVNEQRRVAIPFYKFGKHAFLNEKEAKKYLIDLATELIEQKSKEIEELRKIIGKFY